jgi:hypothetical protein
MYRRKKGLLNVCNLLCLLLTHNKMKVSCAVVAVVGTANAFAPAAPVVGFGRGVNQLSVAPTVSAHAPASMSMSLGFGSNGGFNRGPASIVRNVFIGKGKSRCVIVSILAQDKNKPFISHIAAFSLPARAAKAVHSRVECMRFLKGDAHALCSVVVHVFKRNRDIVLNCCNHILFDSQEGCAIAPVSLQHSVCICIAALCCRCHLLLNTLFIF